MTEFAHGGDVTGFARMCGCGVDEVIDFSSNINFVTPHIDLDLSTLPLAAYPDDAPLYRALSEHYGVEAEGMELFGGASAGIFAFLRWARERLLPPESPRCVLYAPAYLEYKRAAEILGYDLHIIDRLNHLEEPVPPRSLVVFVNPATPDGQWYDLAPLLAAWAERECTVLIDESFVELSLHPSIRDQLDAYPRLYILHSMTKYWGAAGVRVGMLLSQPDNIRPLKAAEPLWKLSAFDSAYLLAALRDTTFAERSRLANLQNKFQLMEILSRSPLVEYSYPSDANYLLARLADLSADKLQRLLIPDRILIRSCENFDGLDEYHARFAVKSDEDLARLSEALDA